MDLNISIYCKIPAGSKTSVKLALLQSPQNTKDIALLNNIVKH